LVGFWEDGFWVESLRPSPPVPVITVMVRVCHCRRSEEVEANRRGRRWRSDLLCDGLHHTVLAAQLGDSECAQLKF
jgi:hypothetical protein